VECYVIGGIMTTEFLLLAGHCTLGMAYGVPLNTALLALHMAPAQGR